MYAEAEIEASKPLMLIYPKCQFSNTDDTDPRRCLNMPSNPFLWPMRRGYESPVSSLVHPH